MATSKAVKKRRFVAMSPKQRMFYESTSKIVAFCSGLGAGKSRCGATTILLKAKNGESHLCVSPTYTMLRKSTLVLMQQVAKELGVLKKTVLTPYPVVTFETQDKGVAEAMFCSADQPDTLRGSNNDSCWLDEASYMPREAFEIAVSRLRGVGGKMGQCRLTMTPRGRSHWTFRVFYDDAPWQPDSDEEGRLNGFTKIGPKWYKPKEGTHLVQAATWENPFISEEYYKQLKDLYSSAFAEQELEGQFVDVLGLLFKREWFAMKYKDVAPRKARRVRYWDLAATEFDGCYTCGALLAMTDTGEVYIEDVQRGQWSTMVRNMMIQEVADRDKRRYNNEVSQVFEQEPGSGGKEQAFQMARMLAGMPVFKDMPSRAKGVRTAQGEKLPGAAKVYRAQPLAAQCVPPNALIHVKSNGHLYTSKRADEVAVGDSVLTHTGQWKPVTTVMTREYSGQFVSMKPRGWAPMVLTPEHPVYCANGYAGQKRRIHPPNWLPAQYVREGDFVLECIDSDICDLASIDLAMFQPDSVWLNRGKVSCAGRHNSHVTLTDSTISFDSVSARPVNRHIPIDYDFCRLIGYYLAEGSTTDREVRWSFCHDEHEWISDVKDIVKRHFGVNMTSYTGENSTTVSLSSCFIRNFFQQFGPAAPVKRITRMFMHLPPDKQAHLIKGMWRGDGCLSRGVWPVLSYTTSSFGLARDLKMLLYRQGIVPILSVLRSIPSQTEIKGRKINSGCCYAVKVGNANADLLAEITGFPTPRSPDTKSRLMDWIDSGVVYRRIQKIEHRDYSGTVYNFEVADDNSYQTDSGLVHNCEAGNVWLVRGNWNDEWLSEITAFPEMKICDQVDACSAAYNYLAKSKLPIPGDIVTVSGEADLTRKYGHRAAVNELALPSFVRRN